MKKSLLFLVAVVASVFGLVGCSAQSTTDENTLSVVDFQSLTTTDWVDVITGETTDEPLDTTTTDTTDPATDTTDPTTTDTTTGATDTTTVNPVVAPTVVTDPAALAPYLDIVNNYFGVLDQVSVVNGVSDNELYTDLLLVTVPDFNGGIVSASLYYNLAVSEDGSQTVDALLVYGESQFVVTGNVVTNEFETVYQLNAVIDETVSYNLVISIETNEIKVGLAEITNGEISRLLAVKVESTDTETKTVITYQVGADISKYSYKVSTTSDYTYEVKYVVKVAGVTTESGLAKWNETLDETTGEIVYEVAIISPAPEGHFGGHGEHGDQGHHGDEDGQNQSGSCNSDQNQYGSDHGKGGSDKGHHSR